IAKRQGHCRVAPGAKAQGAQKMRLKAVALLFWVAALGSCVAEGGSRGSGISTSIVGNVVSVQSGAATRPTSSGSSRARAATRQSLRLLTIARANTEIEGIVVRIEDTDIETQTDSSGAFTLQGDFDGKRTLVFQLPRDSGAA